MTKKYRIVANLDDHEGYKGEELKVITNHGNDYYTVQNDKGLTWMVGEEELEIILPKEEKFAKDMSVLLYEMRIEDINGTILTDSQNEQIPVDFIDKIIDDPKHADIVKTLIYESVLDAVKAAPRTFMNAESHYEYTSDCYDHAYLVDSYVQAKYESTQKKTVYICTHCNSDNVRVNAWVKPNQNYRFLTELIDEIGYCDDCNLPSVTETCSLSRDAKVIGFQVVGEDGTPEEGEIHPHMDASFCIYNLTQARSMMDDDNQGEEHWRLLTIWSGDVEDPTMMFKGNPRN